MPTNFSVNVDQQKPFNFHITIGEKTLLLGALALAAMVYIKKRGR